MTSRKPRSLLEGQLAALVSQYSHDKVLEALNAVQAAESVYKQYTIECRLHVRTDNQSADGAMRDALGQAAKQIYAVGTLLGVIGPKGEPACTVVCFSDDFFKGNETLTELGQPSG